MSVLVVMLIADLPDDFGQTETAALVDHLRAAMREAGADEFVREGWLGLDEGAVAVIDAAGLKR